MLHRAVALKVVDQCAAALAQDRGKVVELELGSDARRALGVAEDGPVQDAPVEQRVGREHVTVSREFARFGRIVLAQMKSVVTATSQSASAHWCSISRSV